MLREDRYGQVQSALVVLLIASALLLLIACINVANLLLSRATTRRREVALRLALGASGRRVAFQLFVESVLLALAGGGTGILLVSVLTRIAATSLPGILGAAGHDPHGRDGYWGRSADFGGNWNRVRSGSGAGNTEGAVAFGAQAG